MSDFDYYYNEIYEVLSNQCTAGEIDEEEMENKLDRVMDMTERQRKDYYRRLTQ